MKKGVKVLDRSDKSLLDNGLQRELKEVNTILNKFLKLYFTVETQSLEVYLHRVKDLLIELTTKPASPILTNVFSKFSNILQPFTSYSYDLSFDSLKNQINTLRQDNLKLKKKAKNMNNQLEDYRIKSARSMDFIYMLRVNNINVDEIYHKGVSRIKPNLQYQQEWQEKIGRVGVQVNREQLLNGLNQESNLTSQYVSLKSKR